ncbi:MAG: ice-binding family protein [Saccharofermentanales bacterium]
MKISDKVKVLALILPILMVMVTVPAGVLAQQAPVNLGTTASFAVMAGTTITNTGTTVINGDAGGDVGLYPGSDFTGQSTVTMSGALHINDTVAIQATTDLVAAYDDAAGRTPATLIPAELGGTTLTPGVYYSTEGSFLITGTLTLDAQNDPDGVFVFLTTTTLITADDSRIDLVNAARYCRIFWKVGSSATLGVNSHFVGHIFALTSITANTGASIQGQLLARNGAVTLQANTIMNGLCAEEANPQTSDTASVVFFALSIMICVITSAVFLFRRSKQR